MSTVHRAENLTMLDKYFSQRMYTGEMSVSSDHSLMKGTRRTWDSIRLDEESAAERLKSEDRVRDERGGGEVPTCGRTESSEGNGDEVIE